MGFALASGVSRVNGVTFLVPQELNASRPATPKMDSARMTMFAGNGVAPQRQLIGGQGQILGSRGIRQEGGGLAAANVFLAPAGD